jgi:hypothetical protein
MISNNVTYLLHSITRDFPLDFPTSMVCQWVGFDHFCVKDDGKAIEVQPVQCISAPSPIFCSKATTTGDSVEVL